MKMLIKLFNLSGNSNKIVNYFVIILLKKHDLSEKIVYFFF